MNGGWHVDLARVGDGSDIARLFGEVPPAPLRELTIWGSPRFSQYFADVLERQAAPAMPRVFVLRNHHRVGGAISLRALDGEIVLDNLSVESELRAHCWGLRLMIESIEAAAVETSASVVVSDVFAGRKALENFHRSLGGVEQVPRGWWTCSPPVDQHHQPAAEVRGLPEADRQHTRWGFSSFTVITSCAEYSVGRLPGAYFRLTDPQAANDPQLLAALASLDTHRRLFLIGPADPPAANWTRVALLRRFKARRDTLLGALKRYFAGN